MEGMGERVRGERREMGGDGRLEMVGGRVRKDMMQEGRVEEMRGSGREEKERRGGERWRGEGRV